MNIKKIVSAASALAISVSAFAGMAVVANAEVVDSYAEDFEKISESPFTATGRYTAKIAAGTGDNTTNTFTFTTANNNQNGDGSYAYKAAEHKIVEASFDFNIAGGYMSIGLADASDYTTGMKSYKKSNDMSKHSIGTAFLIGTTRQSGEDWYGVNNAKANSLTKGTWYHAVVTIDYTTSTIDYAIYTYAADADYSEATAVVSGADAAFMDSNVKNVDSIIVQSSSNNSTAYIDNIDLNTDSSYLVAANYTVNYQLEGETVVTETGSDAVGTVITAEQSVVDEDGTKYIITDTTAPNVTLTAGENVLNVPVRLAEKYDVKVDAVGDIERNLVTDKAVEGEDYSYSYPAYLTDDSGKFYKAEATTYGEDISAASDKIQKEVTYNLDENVVAFIEGEDAPYNGGQSNIVKKATLSGGKAQSVQRGSTESLKFTFNAPVDGKYKLYAALYNADSKERGYDIYVDDAAYTTSLKYDKLSGNTAGVMELEVELKAGEHTVYYAINYNLTPAVDYMVVSLVEATSTTVTATNLGGFAGDDGSAATAFKAVMGNVTGALNLKVTPSTGEAKTFNGFATLTDANVVLGIIVNGLNDAAATAEITIK